MAIGKSSGTGYDSVVRLTFCLLALTFCLAAQDFNFPPPNPAAGPNIGTDVGAPLLIRKVEPIYSEQGRKAKMNGSVLLSITINTRGEPTNPKVVRPLGLGLDERAINALEQWRFRPASSGGKPIAVNVNIEMNFRLIDHGWVTEKVEFANIDSAHAPVFLATKFPKAAYTPEAKVVLKCEISSGGHPTQIYAEQASNDQSKNEWIAVLKDWSFTPATRGGKAIAIPATFEFAQHKN